MAVVCALAALALPAWAGAHVTLSPPFVEAGVETTVAFETPNERPPHATVGLVVEAPAGVSFSAVTPPKGWRLHLETTRVEWTGGRIEGARTFEFRVRVLARTRAGNQVFRAVQRYDDGEDVRWPATLSVLPAEGAAAPSQHLGRALAAAAAGLVALAGSLVVLRRLRRRPLQER